MTLEKAAAIAENVYFEDYDKEIIDELHGGWKLIGHYDGGSSLQIGAYARGGPDGKEEYILR